jgi:hypothetical protein
MRKLIVTLIALLAVLTLLALGITADQSILINGFFNGMSATK